MKELKILNLYKIKNFNVVCAYSSKNERQTASRSIKICSKKNADKSSKYNIRRRTCMLIFLASKNAKMKFVFAKYGYGRDN